jgi:hypothetical protein
VATFGNNGHLERWPREIARNYREEHGRPIGKRFPVKRICEKALQLYPLLEKWGTEDFGWSDLMFIESQAMIGAMCELMTLGIPSLSVHDQLDRSGLQARSRRTNTEQALPKGDWRCSCAQGHRWPR